MRKKRRREIRKKEQREGKKERTSDKGNALKK
jgi:hypothetical protein